MRAISLAVCVLAAFAAVSLYAASAQNHAPAAQAVRKTTLQDLPFPAPRYHTVTVRTRILRGGEVEPHTHPGVETAYVLSIGDSFSIPRGVAHSMRNTGQGDLVILSTYVVEKGKPIVIPARRG